jgi:hypothetical protein
VGDHADVQPPHVQTQPDFEQSMNGPDSEVDDPHSPSTLLNSRRASDGHHTRETMNAQTTPIVTEMERSIAMLRTDVSRSRVL